MRSAHAFLVRAGTFALLAVLCAHCGSTQGATRGGGKTDAGDEASPDGDADGGGEGGVTDPEASDADAGVPDANGGDATVVALAGNDHCTNASTIPLSGANPRIDIVTTTVGATHDVDAFCSSDQGADVFYQFAFSKRVFVYADTFGASWNTVLFLLSDTCEPITTTMTGGAACSDDGCATAQSQIVAVLEPGSYRLGLAGHGSEQGAATIHFEWALAGSGAVAPLPPTDSVQVGTTTGSGNIDGLSNTCIAAGPEDSYWWARCPSDPARTIHASTCGGGTTWESVIETQVPRSAPGLSSGYRCNVDGCDGTFQATLGVGIPAGAGLGVLSIDGQSGSDVGPYTMAVTYTP